MRIIVDAMGGDNAPYEIVKGTYAASLEYDASFILVGDKEQIEAVAAENEYDLEKFEIIDLYQYSATRSPCPCNILS